MDLTADSCDIPLAISPIIAYAKPTNNDKKQQPTEWLFLLDIFSHPNTPIDVLKSSLVTLTRVEKRELACAPQISESLQLLLAEDESLYILYCLARNPACCEQAQLRLADSDNAIVLHALIHREPFISEAIQLKLAAYCDIDIPRDLAQMALAANTPLLPRGSEQAHAALPLVLKSYRLNALLFLARHPAISPRAQMLLAPQRFIWNEYEWIEPPEGVTKEWMLRNMDQEEQIRNALSHFKAMVTALATNPQLSEETLLYFVQRKDEKFDNKGRADVARNPSLSHKLQLQLANGHFYFHEHLAKNPNLDPTLQLRFVRDKDSDEVTWYLAENPYINETTQLHILKRSDKFARELLLKNPNFNAQVMHKVGGLFMGQLTAPVTAINAMEDYPLDQQLAWASNKDIRIRMTLASNVHLCEAVQLKLAHDHERYVRRTVAENPTINAAALHLLTNDINLAVRTALASNPQISEITQLNLTDDPEFEVRSALALNARLGNATFDKLFNDRHSYVQRALADKTPLSDTSQLKLLDHPDVYVRYQLAENPSINTATRDKLMQDDPRLMPALARNPQLSVDVMFKLAEHPCYTTRRVLTMRLDLPQALKLSLSVDDHVEVRQILAKNPTLSADIQLRLANDQERFVLWNMAEHPQLCVAAQLRLAESMDQVVRSRLLNNPALATPTLIKLAATSTGDERLTLFHHPNCTDAVVEVLLDRYT